MASENRRRRRGRKKKNSHITAVIGFIAVIFAAVFIIKSAASEILGPSHEEKDLNEWFEVSGDEVRLFLNDVPDMETKAVCIDGEVYLPLEWTKEELNRRFFYSDAEDMLTLTEPTVIHDYHEGDSLEGQHFGAFVKSDGEIFVSLSAAEQFTDIEARRYTEQEPAKRVFIYKGSADVKLAETLKDTQLRTKADKKAPILTELEKGEKLTYLDQSGEWARVSSQRGFIGYVPSSEISSPELAAVDYGSLSGTGAATSGNDSGAAVGGSSEGAAAAQGESEGSGEGAAAAQSGPEGSSGSSISVIKNYDIKRSLLDEKVIMGWHLVTGPAGNDSFGSLYANTGGKINVVSPTWLQICSADGEISSYSDRSYVDAAHAAGVKVWAVVDNFNNEGSRDFSTGQYFSLSSNRRSFTERLLEDAEKYGYDGFNLDFEGISADAGEAFVEFVRELSVFCREKGLTLSVDNYVPYSYNDFYDIEEQGVYADYVVIMGYDEHTADSAEAGSSASIGYTDYGIKKTLEMVPAERVINGIPFFTRLWELEERTGENSEKNAAENTGADSEASSEVNAAEKAEMANEAGGTAGNAGTSVSDNDAGGSVPALSIVSSRAMGMNEALKYAAAEGFDIAWDEETGQNIGTKRDGEHIFMIWLEDEKSVEEKMELIRDAGLGGTACWRLGLEPGSVWDSIHF